MNPPDHPPVPPAPGEDPVRAHTYDGISEYDKRLPNWWLLTLYATIIFGIVYWLADQHFARTDDAGRLLVALQSQEAIKLAAMDANKLDDKTLWDMSRNPAIVARGKALYEANCVVCHLPSLRGKAENPTAIGASLLGTRWIYGGRPLEIMKTVAEGTSRGMTPWGPVLGAQRVSEVTAYVLSYHQEGEPIEVVPSPAAGVK